jgi:hypothetical protein
LQLRLCLFELRAGLLDLGLLAVDLRRDIGHVGQCNGHLRLGLIDRDLVVAIVNPGEQVTCVDVLVIGHGYFGHVAAHLRRDRETAGRDESVVGRFIVTDVEPVGDATDQDDQENTCAGSRQHPMLAQAVAQGRLFGSRRRAVLRLMRPA